MPALSLSLPLAAVAPAPVTMAPTRKRRKIPGAQRLRNFLCMHPGCEKSFTDSAHLRDHTTVHTGEKRLRCAHCDRRFARLSTLHEHQRVHTGEKPYVCPADGCSKRYASRAALRFHATSHATATFSRLLPAADQDVDTEAPPEAILSSPVLASAAVSGATDREDASVRSLEATIRQQQDQIAQLQHELERLRQRESPPARAKTSEPPPRATPPAGERSSEAMTAPVQFLRDGVKPFECRVCLHRFVNFYQLSFHSKQHAGESLERVVGDQTPIPVGPKFCPEHGCEYSEAAGKSLRSLQTLKRHWLRRHQSERPYVCTYCPPAHPKAFKTRENLKAHEKDCRRPAPAAAG